MVEKNYKSKRVVVDDRTFLIEFWNDDLGLPWYRVYEIETRMRRKHWFTKQMVQKKVYLEFCSHWTTDNRVDMAMASIKEYIQQGKNKVAELKAVDEFCKEDTEVV